MICRSMKLTIEAIESTWRSVATLVTSIFVGVQTAQEALPQLAATLPPAIYDAIAGTVNMGATWLTGLIAVGGVLRGAWVSWKSKQTPEVQ